MTTRWLQLGAGAVAKPHLLENVNHIPVTRINRKFRLFFNDLDWKATKRLTIASWDCVTRSKPSLA